MSLRAKALTLIFISLATLLGCVEVLFSSALLEQMAALEQEQMTEHAVRVEEALKARIEAIPTRLLDWANWDDTYAFIEDKNRDYIESNLLTEGIGGLETNFILYFDDNSDLVHSKALDFRKSIDREMPAEVLQYFDKSRTVMQPLAEDEGRSGIAILEKRPLIFGMRPILKSDKSGPARGRLVWARYLDEVEIQDIAMALKLPVEVTVATPSLRANYPEWRSPGPASPFAFATSDTEIESHALLNDYYGEPALHVKVQRPRSVYQRGVAADRVVFLGLLVMGALFALIFSIAIERVLLRRIRSLSTRLHTIAQEDDYSGRLDVTGKDELSAFAAKVNEALEALAKNRESLFVAKEVAERASANKSLFVSTMSHEVRTPVNGIIGIADSLKQENLTPGQQSKVAILSDCAESLYAIVNDVLDFAKIEAGKVELESIVFDLEALANRAVNTVFQKAQDKTLKLEKHIDPEIPRVLVGDPTRLGQVIINLLSNAIKFTSEGSVKLSLGAKGRTATSASFEVRVSDTGVGMTEAQKAKIFQAFTQADASITRRFGGTGLGLSISKTIVELMGGSLTVESAVAAGSAFSFTVTLPRGDPKALEDSGSEEEMPERPLSVVVVDDKETNRKVASMHLTSLGHTCIELDSGQALIDFLKETSGSKKADIVLLDVQMPFMSGPEAAQIICDNAFFGGVKVPLVALTAQSKGDFGADEREDLFDSWLPKPLRLPDLKKLLGVYGRHARSASEPGGPLQQPVWPSLHGIDSAFLWTQYCDRETIAEMLDCFIEESEAIGKALAAALTARDPEETARQLHALRSSFLNAGAMSAADESKRLEHAVLEAKGAAFHRFDAELQSLLVRLKSHRDAISCALAELRASEPVLESTVDQERLPS